jgi:hypothetical protein
MKQFACVSILAFSFLGLASAAKTYHITLASATKVGSLELQAGDYAVRVNGSDAVFTNEDTAKKFTTPVKVENANQKFDQTAVVTTKDSGEDMVQDIQLAGTSTQLDFGE